MLTKQKPEAEDRDWAWEEVVCLGQKKKKKIHVLAMVSIAVTKTTLIKDNI